MHLALTIFLGILAFIFIILFIRENRYSKRLEGAIDDRRVDIKILEGSRDRAIGDFNHLSRIMEGKFRGLGFTGKDDSMIKDAASMEKISNVVSENRAGFEQRETERKEKERREAEEAQAAAKAAWEEQQKKVKQQQRSNGFDAATGSVGFATIVASDFGSSGCDSGGGGDC